MRRLVVSDWHVIDGRQAEPCDRELVRRFVAEAVALGVSEVILAGDIIDITRGGSGCIPAAAQFLGQAVGVPLGAAGIYCSYVFGNHDWTGGQAPVISHAIYAAGFRPELFRCSTGPEFRGPWQIEHGHRFDCWNRGGWLTHLARAATRIDGEADRVGVELEVLSPVDWHPGMQIPELDLPTHQQANRWAAATGQHLVIGHSHACGDVSGWRGKQWRVLNPGAMVKGEPYSYVWITDEGDGGLGGECV